MVLSLFSLLCVTYCIGTKWTMTMFGAESSGRSSIQPTTAASRTPRGHAGLHHLTVAHRLFRVERSECWWKRELHTPLPFARALPLTVLCSACSVSLSSIATGWRKPGRVGCFCFKIENQWKKLFLPSHPHCTYASLVSTVVPAQAESDTIDAFPSLRAGQNHGAL